MTLDERAARVGQAEELGALVEGLAGGVVDRAGDHPDREVLAEPHEQRVAAGDHDAEVREQRRARDQEARGFLRVQRQEDRVDVRAQVVDADQRAAGGQGQGSGQRDAHREAR